ncbi:hypothetical protein MtrunA17_Chr5g0399241 [Medicago truncatula]|uniref:Transmembrane protein n=1 Tax=Medicago truncatula TaxID=3880 RepID=A0A396HKA1_MEDTR|nr:hypothetical protein MtrunA17_Chr5g0399241 [Medicago truncatula]
MWRSGVSGIRTPAPAYKMHLSLPTEQSLRGHLCFFFIISFCVMILSTYTFFSLISSSLYWRDTKCLYNRATLQCLNVNFFTLTYLKDINSFQNNL